MAWVISNSPPLTLPRNTPIDEPVPNAVKARVAGTPICTSADAMVRGTRMPLLSVSEEDITSTCEHPAASSTQKARAGYFICFSFYLFFWGYRYLFKFGFSAMGAPRVPFFHLYIGNDELDAHQINLCFDAVALADFQCIEGTAEVCLVFFPLTVIERPAPVTVDEGTTSI
ncbi:hypothetical protein SFC43_13950 [Bacteroides sp. CR5/BHMF/2]|nr:hypothetical protein [Bacteroides sp. CR5/BHMF/2]